MVVHAGRPVSSAITAWRRLPLFPPPCRARIRTGQPPNPVPCILLGQLATDPGLGRRGIGTGLFNHALARSVSGAALIGGRALVVNAVDDEAAVFWRRRGFLPSRDDALVLFRSIADIAASLEAAADGDR